MTAISRRKVRIAIVDTGTNAADVATTDYIEGEIKSYNKSGGEREVESDPVFGGYVDKEKPISQVEISFEVVPSLEYADRWDALAYSADSATGVYTMAGDVTDKAVFITTQTGETSPKTWGFNNCSVIMYDIEHNADDNQTGNFNLKFSPTDSSGVSNFITKATDIGSMPDWTSLDNN